MNSFYNRKRELITLELDSKGSACYNLYAARTTELLAGMVIEVPVDLISKLQPSSCCTIFGSKGHRDAGVFVIPCVVDSDWEGDWIVPLLSLNRDYMVKAGDKVGQFMINPFSWDNVENPVKFLGTTADKKAQDSMGDTNTFIPLPTMLKK